MLRKLKMSIIISFAAALIFGTPNSPELARVQKELLIFPQLTGSAAAEKEPGSDRITYSFKIAEIFEKFFGKNK